MVSAHARRQQVKYALGRGLSSRNACALMNVARSTLNYQALLPVKDAPVVAVMRDLSAQYPRFGYRRIGVYVPEKADAIIDERLHPGVLH